MTVSYYLCYLEISRSTDIASRPRHADPLDNGECFKFYRFMYTGRPDNDNNGAAFRHHYLCYRQTGKVATTPRHPTQRIHKRSRPVASILSVKKMAPYLATLLLLATVFCLGDARPKTDVSMYASTDIDLAIMGGSNAAVGAWPWQLSLERLGSTWSHTCGASLLSSAYSLCAAHCLDGSSTSTLRIVAGLYDRSDYTGTQITDLAGYKIHELYNTGSATYGNDIAIITHQNSIVTGGNVAAAVLPTDNNNQLIGFMCTITGWGRTSSSDVQPDILQQADVEILSTAECQSLIGTVGSVWEGQICVYDRENVNGACNGDSGGPLNCPDGFGGYIVAGVTSWIVASGSGQCLVSFPSVYTRTAYYLYWIETNTP